MFNRKVSAYLWDMFSIAAFKEKKSMGLFKKSNEEKGKKELKGQIGKLMKSYDKEKIDRDTYFKKMMDLTTSYKKKK